MKSVMDHKFSEVPSANIPRSSFNRTHGVKTTFDVNNLVPIFTDEALPGDTFNVNMTGFSRMSTPIYPVMDNMFMETFFFAVPIRLVMDDWQKLNGEQENPGDSTDFIMPTMTSPQGGYDNESLSDYLGIPTNVTGLEHTSIYHRSYKLIRNEWFRDQNIQDTDPLDKGPGPDVDTDFPLYKRGKRHDYFTSCLPFPQKGESIDLPLGQTAPITGWGGSNQDYTTPNQTAYETGGITTTHVNSKGNNFSMEEDPDNPGFPLIQADLSNATAATINQLRQAFQVQKLLERDARGGTRYTEVIRAHFGVVSPDARLQRPEYLGGGSTMVNTFQVPQTSETQGGGTPQGTLAAFATANLNNHGFTKSFTEHCVIIGLVNVRADLTYQQGLERKFSRSTRYDFYWPALSHIGEQAVLNKEIYAQGTAADDDVFGYQERHAEYRYKPSIITGKFRSNDPLPLDSWHVSQEFQNLPTLSPEFIEEDTPMDRILAVTNEPDFIFDAYIKMKCARPMPTYSVPGLIDHF